MPYNYQELRPKVLTEEGQRMFTAIRENAKRVLSELGHATLEQLTTGFSGTNWDHFACVDRMVELGELYMVAKGDMMQDNLYRGKWSRKR